MPRPAAGPAGFHAGAPLRSYKSGAGAHPPAPSPEKGCLPAPGPRDGDRAPPRGVDVKPRSAGLPDPGQGPLEAARRALRTVSGTWSPGPGIWEPPGSREAGMSGPDLGARGVLHQPLAPGPCPRPGQAGTPSGVRGRKNPKFGVFSPKTRKIALFGHFPGIPRKPPFLEVQGPAARG